MHIVAASWEESRPDHYEQQLETDVEKVIATRLWRTYYWGGSSDPWSIDDACTWFTFTQKSDSNLAACVVSEITSEGKADLSRKIRKTPERTDWYQQVCLRSISHRGIQFSAELLRFADPTWRFRIAHLEGGIVALNASWGCRNQDESTGKNSRALREHRERSDIAPIEHREDTKRAPRRHQENKNVEGALTCKGRRKRSSRKI